MILTKPDDLSTVPTYPGDQVYIDTCIWVGFATRRKGDVESKQPAEVLRHDLWDRISDGRLKAVTSSLVKLEFAALEASRLSRLRGAFAPASEVEASVLRLAVSWESIGVPMADIGTLIQEEYGSATEFLDSASQVSRGSVMRPGGLGRGKWPHLGLLDSMHVSVAERIGAKFIVSEDKAFEGIIGTNLEIVPLVLARGTQE